MFATKGHTMGKMKILSDKYTNYFRNSVLETLKLLSCSDQILLIKETNKLPKRKYVWSISFKRLIAPEANL